MFPRKETRSGRRDFCRVNKTGQNDSPRALLSQQKRRGQTRGIGTGMGGVQTLNVIVEGGVFVAIEIQVFEGVVSGEVLERHMNPAVNWVDHVGDR